jgi:hypothetical protein
VSEIFSPSVFYFVFIENDPPTQTQTRTHTMNKTLLKITAITALAAAATFGLSACSSGSDNDSDSDNSSTSQLVGPIVVEVADLDGTTVEVNVDQMVDINTGDTDPADFTGKVADSKVAEFVAGGPDGSATFNPGVTGLAMGSTTVELTNTKTGDVITFTVTVK